MSIYQDEKDMQYMPDSAVEAYKEGKGSKPDEQLLALLEQQKRLGLEADKQAEQNRPMPTVAQQVQQKAGLMDLQKMAQRLGVQITGMAPIGAPMMGSPGQPQPMMNPQGQPSPAGIAAAAPQIPGLAMPQAVPQAAPQAARPMAHGGIAHAAPSHMFKFAHGGGVLGFDEGGKADALAAVNAAMPAETPEHTSLTPMEYDRQRQLALDAVISNFTPPAARQETYGERDVRMHNQPPLTSYKDPFSVANIMNAINPPVPKFTRSTLPVTDEDAAAQAQANAPTPQVTAPVTPPVAQQATPPVTARPAAGLPSALPPAHPNKVLAQTTPTGTVTGAPGVPSAQPVIEDPFAKVALESLKEPSMEDLISKKKKLNEAFGLDKPYGEETIQDVGKIRDIVNDMVKAHPREKLSALLTGIVSGGYAGGAPAAQANEEAYRNAVVAQYKNINDMLSPVYQQRRTESLANAKSITDQLSEAQKEKAQTARTIYDRNLANKSSAELEAIRQAGENHRSQLNRDTQIALKNMEINNPNRAPNANDIVKLLKNDENYKGKSDAELMQAAIEIQNGSRSKQAQITALNDTAKILTARLNDPMNTDESMKAQQASHLNATLQRLSELADVKPVVNQAPQQAIDFLSKNPSSINKQFFKQKYGYLPEGI